MSPRSLDPENTGFVEEIIFRKMMKSKEGISDNDVNEMLAGEKNIIANFFTSSLKLFS